MVALNIHFYFIKNRLLNPKKAFWNAVTSWGSWFLCFGLFWVWGKGKCYSRYSFQTCQKTNTSYTLISSIIICELVKKSRKTELWMHRQKTVHLPQTNEVTATRERTSVRGKTQKRKSFLTLNYKISPVFLASQIIIEVFYMRKISTNTCNSPFHITR